MIFFFWKMSPSLGAICEGKGVRWRRYLAVMWETTQRGQVANLKSPSPSTNFTYFYHRYFITHMLDYFISYFWAKLYFITIATHFWIWINSFYFWQEDFLWSWWTCPQRIAWSSSTSHSPPFNSNTKIIMFITLSFYRCCAPSKETRRVKTKHTHTHTQTNKQTKRKAKQIGTDWSSSGSLYWFHSLNLSTLEVKRKSGFFVP